MHHKKLSLYDKKAFLFKTIYCEKKTDLYVAQ